MVPAVAVEGVGAVALPVPPEATVYHNRLVPVAVIAEAVSPSHYTTGEVTPGAEGKALMVTSIWARGPSQPLALVWDT